jgi:AraC family transcriptional regulator of adaptative response/methylated-DNA-[protein]-cysteine methyltransferase
MNIQSQFISTPLGQMQALAIDDGLLSLKFIDCKAGSEDEDGGGDQANHPILAKITSELKAYFAGELKVFKTPIVFAATDFQLQVWQQLLAIPYGHTISYAAQATAIGRPKAYRAVASANGQNKLAIIVPCHRVIASSGALSGYAFGPRRKEWLLRHEGVKL